MEPENIYREAKSRIELLEKRIRELEHEVILARKESNDANRKKTMFLANMSHEIRTPMNSILGIYDLLKETDLTQEQREYLEIIHIASQNLLIIINDILDLSKIEAGELHLETKPFNLHEEIGQVIKLLSLKAKGKGIELSSRIDSATPVCVIGDSVRLKQILINLANNALKFTNQGMVQVSVEPLDPSSDDFEEKKLFVPQWIDPGQLLPDQRILKFDVIDTGIGISERDQETLFTEFAQLENPLVRRFEGTGLGLSISNHLTTLLKGKMGVISTTGKGSDFWFSLLVKTGDVFLLNQTETKALTDEKNRRPLDVLLVEDNLLNQKFAMITLKREGHHVEVAVNGEIAIEKFQKKHYDLILMDIAMPVMDGMKATRAIREIEHEKRKQLQGKNPESFVPVKIVAITAHIMIADKEKCLNAGMNGFLSKPYRPNDLLDIIRELKIT
ncbi:MAG: response regulator [Bacteroidales bacterium]|nr:response regulator [Bacteroidales bacterium]